MKFQAVLFDLDGTLLDTLEDLARSMNRVLELQGFPQHELDAYRLFVGDGLENLVRRAVPGQARKDGDLVSTCVEAMRREYGARWSERTRPYDGIPRLLHELQARGLRLAVLSNKPHDFTCRMVQEFFASRPFEVVFGERPGVQRKPDPISALEIAEKLRTPPGRFLYLGDTRTDMLTAVAAGMFPVGVLWGFRGAEELLDAGAQALIRKPGELLEYLEETP